MGKPCADGEAPGDGEAEGKKDILVLFSISPRYGQFEIWGVVGRL